MKRLFFLIMVGLCILPVNAQIEGGVIHEVTVKGSRLVQKNDGQWIYPTETELKHSTNAYSLLGKLSLNGIRVDQVGHTLTALDNRGSVSVRINDVPATVQDMLSLDMASVERIEYTDRPGLRDGEDVAYAINIVVRRPTSGYVLGTDLTHDLTRRGFRDNVFGRYNMGKSEWGVDYTLGYADQREGRVDETADYLLTDGTMRTITRRDLNNRNYSFSNIARLTYNLSDSNYVMQARFTYEGDLRPSLYHQERAIMDAVAYTAIRDDHGQTHSPAFDLYYHQDFRRNQKLTASATVTHIHTDNDNSYDEGVPYDYKVKGSSWSLKSEALYENQLKPFTLTLGLQYHQKFTKNEYSGDAMSSSLIHSSEQYLFSQLNGTLFQSLQYTFGVGASCRYYRQGNYHHNFLVFRPRINVSYSIAPGLRLSYIYQRSQHTSQIAFVNDVALRVNSMELLVGNPDLKPTSVTEHTMRMSYNRPRLSAQLQGYAKLNHQPNMHRYFRTAENVFIDTQENQPHCNLLMTEAYARYDLIPDKLNATLIGQYFHFDNKGTDYHHYYNSFVGTMMLNAYLGHWTLTAYTDTGFRWMEGEQRGKNGLEVQLVATYQTGPCSFSLYCKNPFRAHPLVHEAELMNQNLHKLISNHDAGQGNYFGLNFTWRLSHGRKYRDINRTITFEDKDAGILKR